VSGSESGEKFLAAVSQEEGLVHHAIGEWLFLIGYLFFALMAGILYKVATKK
jgi:hypothetical protein